MISLGNNRTHIKSSMPIDATTGRFQETITHDLNSFLSDLIWNSAAMWGLSQSGVANWLYSMAPSMRGEVAEALRGAMVIGLATEVRRMLIRYNFPVGANDLMFVRF